MSELRCDTCRYWVKWDADPKQGECRISPPAPVTSAVGVWPSTHDSDWCGKHEARMELPIAEDRAQLMADVITRWSEVSSIREAVTEWGKCHDRLHDRYENTRRTVEDLQTRLRKIESTRQYTPPANVDK